MWADALLIAERNHLLRLLAWGAACVLIGTSLLLAGLLRRGGRSPLLGHFAMQTALWGAVELVVGFWGWRALAYRDLESFTRFDRMLWLNVGLDAGYVAVGVAVALTGWLAARRLGPVGAGLAVAVQGLALFVLHSFLVDVIARLTVA